MTRLAEDRAEQMKREPDKVAVELERRLRSDLRSKGDFTRVHPLPGSGQDVPDLKDAALVVLRPEQPYGKEAGSLAQVAARSILETRGSMPRLYRNTLVFLAPDKTRLPDLEEAARKFLAWDSIVNEQETLNLTPQQVKQAETQLATANATVDARIPEVYQWVLVPVRKAPQDAQDQWQAIRLSSGSDPLAVRVSKKLKGDELLLSGFAGTRLKMELDRVPLWSGNHVAVKDLGEHFAKFTDLPRLKDASVLAGAIRDGVELTGWVEEGFGFADGYDELTGRYRGLRGGQHVTLIDTDSPGLVVKGAVARAQIEADLAGVSTGEGDRSESGPDQLVGELPPPGGGKPPAPRRPSINL